MKFTAGIAPAFCVQRRCLMASFRTSPIVEQETSLSLSNLFKNVFLQGFAFNSLELIQVQVLADGQGGCAHLYERDCSVQLRNQKVGKCTDLGGIAIFAKFLAAGLIMRSFSPCGNHTRDLFGATVVLKSYFN